MIPGIPARFWAVPSLSTCLTKALPGLSAHLGGQKPGTGLEKPCLLSHNWKTSAGGMLTTNHSPQSCSCSSSPFLQLLTLSQTQLAGTQVTLSSHKKPVWLLGAVQKRFTEGKARKPLFSSTLMIRGIDQGE